MQRCCRRVPIVDKRLVITAAGAYRPRPAGVTVVTGSNVMGTEELIARGMIDAALVYMPHLSDIGIDEAVAKADVACGADAQQTQAGAAGIGLAHTGIQ